MTSRISNRVRQATTHTLARASVFDDIAATTSCTQAADVARFAAEALRYHARIVLGDIGEGAEEWESEPLTTPVEVPAEPVKVPA